VSSICFQSIVIPVFKDHFPEAGFGRSLPRILKIWALLYDVL